MSSFFEYLAPDGSKWRVERGDEFCRTFAIEGDAMRRAETVAEVQRALIGQTLAWTVVRRRYGLFPVVGLDDPREMLPASAEEVAAEMGLPLKEIESLEAQARVLWRRRQSTANEVRAEGDEGAEMTPREQANLLRKYGFPTDLPEEERAFLAMRIRDLAPMIESDNLRSAVRSMLQDEMNLFFILDPAIRALKNKIDEESREKRSIINESDRLQKLLTSRKATQDSVLTTMKELGISDVSNNLKRKRRVQDSLGGMMKAMQEYYAKGDRSLIDGVFTELEVEILCLDYDIRPAQYRPEPAFIVPEAIERLFDPNFAPPKFPRRAHRRLRSAFQSALAAAREDDGEEQPEMLDDGLNEDGDE
jgi:hypothetical protein